MARQSVAFKRIRAGARSSAILESAAQNQGSLSRLKTNERVATVNALLTVGFSFESKPHPPRLG
jgi:hypothetical protein